MKVILSFHHLSHFYRFTFLKSVIEDLVKRLEDVKKKKERLEGVDGLMDHVILINLFFKVFVSLVHKKLDPSC